MDESELNLSSLVLPLAKLPILLHLFLDDDQTPHNNARQDEKPQSSHSHLSVPSHLPSPNR